jgi:hypothetical protein
MGVLMLRFILIFILTLFISCTACNSGSAKTDNDTVPDTDKTPDTETIDEIPDETPDIDLDDEPEVPDIDDEEYIDNDYQGAEECPDLIDAKFPYYNDDKSIHFCRKCDKPTVKDTQCVENLWKDTAAALYKVNPEAECENGYPCDMDSIIPGTIETWEAMEEKVGKKLPYRPHECDRLLSKNPWAADSTAGRVKHFNISDGKVGLFLKNLDVDYNKYRTYAKTMEYDPATQKYRALAPSTMESGAYNKGCMFHVINNFNFSSETNNITRYLAYSCTDGRRRVIYPRTIRYVAYTPALNDNWVIANIEEEDGGPKYTMYAKVDVWEWTKLMPGLSGHPIIVNDKGVFYNEEFKAYYCDFSKNPESVEDCVLINENEAEEIRYPVINKEDESEIMYESDISGKYTIKKLKIGDDGKKSYSVVLDTFVCSDDQWFPVGYALSKVTDEMVFYNEMLRASNGEGDGNACFYNRGTKKTVCMKKVEGSERYYMAYNEWEGNWMVYQFRNASAQAVRDLDCYCEKEGVCPFEEP